MEAHHHTGPMPFVIGGWPDVATGTNTFAIEIPGAVSLVMTGDARASIPGLDAVPVRDRPPVTIVHIAFQPMIACGVAMGLVGLWAHVRSWRRRRGLGRSLPTDTPFLRALALSAPLGFIAVEAGWTVTEVGRQPWIVQGFMRTADAVTSVPGLVVPFVTFTLLYIGLSIAVVWLLYLQIIRTGVGATPFSGVTEELPVPVRA